MIRPAGAVINRLRKAPLDEGLSGAFSAESACGGHPSPYIFNKIIPKPFQNSTLCHLTNFPLYGIIIKIIGYIEKESKWRT